MGVGGRRAGELEGAGNGLLSEVGEMSERWQ